MWHTLRATQGPRTATVRPAARHPYGPRGSLRRAWSGYNTSLAARSPYGPPCGRLPGALRLTCVCLGINFVKNLRPPQGRPKAAVRHHFKGRTAAAGFLSPQIQNTPCGYPNICDCYSMWPWECCGGPIIAIGRRYFRPHGRRGKCDWGIPRNSHM